MTTEIEFHPGEATGDIVRQAWMEVLAELSTPGSEARVEAERLDVDVTALTSASVEVHERDNDFGATILVSIAAPIALHALKTLWDDIVRPRIRSRFGVDAGDNV